MSHRAWMMSGLICLFAGCQRGDQGSALPKLGVAAPAITAQGWVNGDAPTAESLKGKVVVYEVWATW